MTSKKAAAAASVILSLIFSFASGFNHPSSVRHHAAIVAQSSSSSSSSSLRRSCRRQSSSSSRPSSLRMSAESEVDRLRAAAAKAREEYEALVGKKGGGGGATTTTTTTSVAPPTRKNLTVDEARIVASKIDFASGNAASQTSALDALVDSGDFGLWKSAIRRGPTSSSSTSTSMSLLVPFPVTLEGLERRTDGKVTGPSLGIGGDSDVKFEDFRDITVAVVLGSTLLGILALAVLPPNVGATFTYLFALVPIGFIGIGSVAPGVIASVIVAARGGKGEDADLRRERICRHEAGHFLCGYACGLPVRRYEVNSDTGVACVEFHPTGDGSSVNGSGKGELSDSDIAHLSVVAMSGSVAEIMAYGKATGGEADLLELQNCFRKSKDFIGAARQQDLTRWGALTSYGIIKSNMGKYEALVRAFEENKSLADCVSIIEASG